MTFFYLTIFYSGDYDVNCNALEKYCRRVRVYALFLPLRIDVWSQILIHTEIKTEHKT